jgi:hypothetical protein
MKKKITLLIFILVAINKITFAQDTLAKKDRAHINYFINVVPDNYNGPLFGSVNIGRGSHKGLYISFFNWTNKNFKGFQSAITNVTKGNLSGFQFSFINNCYDTLKGLQIGVINITKVNNGTQIGLINYTDTISGGNCFGIVSFVRRATYHGIEIGVNEMLPMNVTYKLGLPDRYASLNFSTNFDFSKLFLGFGTGFTIPIKNRLLFNPDYTFQYSLNSPQKILSVVAKFSYKLSKKLYLSAGPTFAWSFSSIKNDLNTPFYYAYNDISSNEKHRIVVGARLSLRYTLKQKQ